MTTFEMMIKLAKLMDEDFDCANTQVRLTGLEPVVLIKGTDAFKHVVFVAEEPIETCKGIVHKRKDENV